MNDRAFMAVLIAAALSLAACSDDRAELVAQGTDVAPGVKFSIRPGNLRECDEPVIASLSWDATAAGAANVKIFVVDKTSGEEKIFAALGSTGSVDTARWAAPGTTFFLKDGAGSKFLGKLTIKPTKC